MKTNFITKVIAIGIIISFAGLGSFTAIANYSTGNNATKQSNHEGSKGAPIPLIVGTMGNNKWYISIVHISFQIDPLTTKEVDYKIQDTWIKYDGPFTLTDDGQYSIQWYWVDKNGTRWPEIPLEVKIDKTAPTITIAKHKKLIGGSLNFTAAAADATSGLERVEFYLDNRSQTNVTAPPYYWIYPGGGVHDVKAIAYDVAGWQTESNILSTPYSYSFRYSPFGTFIQKLLLRMFGV